VRWPGDGSDAAAEGELGGRGAQARRDGRKSGGRCG
jgi:hypothetical protein